MKKIAIVALLSTAVMSSAAFAADEGFYIGGNVGQASTDVFTLASKTATAIALVGGYQINKNFAVEANYSDFGSITPIGASPVKVTGYGVSAVGILPFNAQWSGFAKLGFESTTMKVPVTNDAKNTSVSYGIGAQYNVNQQLGVRVAYDAYKVGAIAVNGSTATTSVISAGVVYKF